MYKTYITITKSIQTPHSCYQKLLYYNSNILQITKNVIITVTPLL